MHQQARERRLACHRDLGSGPQAPHFNRKLRDVGTRLQFCLCVCLLGVLTMYTPFLAHSHFRSLFSSLSLSGLLSLPFSLNTLNLKTEYEWGAVGSSQRVVLMSSSPK